MGGAEKLRIKIIKKKETQKLKYSHNNFITKIQHPTIPSTIASISLIPESGDNSLNSNCETLYCISGKYYYIILNTCTVHSILSYYSTYI